MCARQLFQGGPSVPTSTSAQAPLSPTALGGNGASGGAAGGGTAGGFGSAPLNTLDEPVWATVKRDLKRIGDNLVLVVFPFRSRDQQSAALRNWDLWGPMVGPHSSRRAQTYNRVRSATGVIMKVRQVFGYLKWVLPC